MNAYGPDLHHLAGAFVLDALEASEEVIFERHLAGCTICLVEVREFRETAALLAHAAARPAPSRVLGTLPSAERQHQGSTFSRRQKP